MITNIIEISLDDYLLGTKLSLPPLGTYCVRHSLSRGGVILGAEIDERIVGIVILEFVPRPRLTYVFVEEKFREKGIGTQLVKAAITHTRGHNISDVKANVILQNQYGEVTDQILRKTGFKMKETAIVIRSANDERCSRQWATFMKERGKRICGAMVGSGYKTLPFSEASSENLEKLKASIGREFPSDLDPFSFISNQADHLVPEYSFITLKDDDPVAFVTVTTVDNITLVFQQLSTALRYQGKGVFLLPFVAFMERFLAGGTCKVSAVIFDRNDRMQRLVQSFISSLVESVKTQNVYKYKL